jgi:hypothetical protein
VIAAALLAGTVAYVAVLPPRAGRLRRVRAEDAVESQKSALRVIRMWPAEGCSTQCAKESFAIASRFRKSSAWK